MQKKDMDYKLIPVYHSGTDDQRRKLADYCLWDAILPKLITEKKLFVRSYLELARISMVPFRFLLTKGQQVKVVALLLQFCKNVSEEDDKSDQYLMPYNVAARKSTEEGGTVAYKGAVVLDPKKGFYNKCVVATLDFSSLYPSIIQAYNLCYCTHIFKSFVEKLGFVLDVDYLIAPNGEFFVKEKQRKGVLPQLLKKLLAARAAVRAEAKQYDPNSDIAKGLDGRQKGIKISANSTYGFTGATVGRLPCLELSSAVTAFGRFLIYFVKAVVDACYLIFHEDHEKYAVRYTEDEPEPEEPAQKRQRITSSTLAQIPSLKILCSQVLGIGDNIVTVMPPEGWNQGPGRMKHPLGVSRDQRLSNMRTLERVPKRCEIRLEVIYGDTGTIFFVFGFGCFSFDS